MFHLAAYTGLLGVGTDLDMAALTDDILTIQNNHFILSQDLNIIAAMAWSPLLDRCKLASPTMRQIAAPYIRPIFTGLTPPTNYNVWLLDHDPFDISPFEEIQAIATSTIGAMTERFTALMWLQTQPESLPNGNIIPLRLTGTGAATANAWTTVAMTFADTLPTGQYAMVLSEHISANAQAHRWIISNQVLRPGFASFTTAQSRHPYALAKGQWGVMGRFKSNDLPRLQVLCNAADAVHTANLHVIRTGNIY